MEKKKKKKKKQHHQIHNKMPTTTKNIDIPIKEKFKFYIANSNQIW